MNNTTTNYIETQAKQQALLFLKNEDEYQAFATPLKPTARVKQEHYNQLVDYFKCEELRQDISLAEQLVKNVARERTSQSTSQVLWEVEHALDTFLARIKEPYYQSHNTLPLQDLCGISNDSLVNMFEQSQEYIRSKRYSEAKALLTYLTVMAPRICSFWISLGVCFENLNDDNEALVAYQVAKTISPQDPQPYLCAALCALKLNERDKAKQELAKAEEMLGYSPELKDEWGKAAQAIAIKLNRGS